MKREKCSETVVSNNYVPERLRINCSLQTAISSCRITDQLTCAVSLTRVNYLTRISLIQKIKIEQNACASAEGGTECFINWLFSKL